MSYCEQNPSTDGISHFGHFRFVALGSQVDLLKDAWLIPVQGQGTFSDPFEVDIRSLAANLARKVMQKIGRDGRETA